MLSTHSAERGAVLIHVALSLLVLCAFSVFAVDWGVFWVSRNQAQNSADAGALAGAVALAYDDINNRTATGPAKRSAFTAARNNRVWGETPNVNIGTDVTFPSCPDGSNSCIRVDVYRDAAHGNALPVFFGSLIGLTGQNVRATAMAQALGANATNCIKPFAIPDKWEERYPTPGAYDPETSSFDTNDNKGKPLANPDQYRPPTQTDMTGYRAQGTPNDIGKLVPLKLGNGGPPGWSTLIDLGRNGGSGVRETLEQCIGSVVKIGDVLKAESGAKTGPTRQGVETLINADSAASWSDPDGPGGNSGKVINSCMQSVTCPTPMSPSPAHSPRIIAIALFNPATFVEGGDFRVVNILGFFLKDIVGNGNHQIVRGYLTEYPGLVATGADNIVDQAAWSRVVTLVR